MGGDGGGVWVVALMDELDKEGEVLPSLDLEDGGLAVWRGDGAYVECYEFVVGVIVAVGVERGESVVERGVWGGEVCGDGAYEIDGFREGIVGVKRCVVCTGDEIAVGEQVVEKGAVAGRARVCHGGLVGWVWG